MGLDELLRALPDGVVAAIGDDGLFRPPPESLPLNGQSLVTEARVATELVEHQAQRAVIEAWDEAMATGSAAVEVPIASLGRPATMHLVDARRDHGVFVMVIDAGEDPPPIRAVSHVSTLASAKVVRVVKDLVAHVQHVDRAVTEVLGWEPEDLIGKRSLDFIHPDDQDKAITAWMDMLDARGLTTRARLRHARADGGWTWLDISNTNHIDEHGRIDCEMVDVTEEVAAIEALHASEQLLRRLTDTLPVGVLHFDARRRVHLANPTIREILGADELTAESVLSRVADPIAVDRAVEAALAGADVDLEVDVLPAGAGGEVRRCMLALRAVTVDGQITGAVACLTDVTDSVRLREELQRRATVDELTGCLNRASALEAVQAALAADVDVAVVYIDLDDFKVVNDGHGHAAGDEVLQAVGARLRAAVREHDVVGRMGGDEFIAVCTGLGTERSAVELAGRIAETLGDPVAFRRMRIDTAASVGVAWVPANGGVDADALVARADADMYRLKGGGRSS
jgi:diguanylate cyclase (GGDEF)-like protein/PAS domain S-box-containing protein